MQNLSLSDDPPTPRRPLQKYSCVTCAHRKIKCDRQIPCSHCIKNASTCEYREPPPPQRRKRGAQAPPGGKPEGEAELRVKVQQYEALLRKLGIDVKAQRKAVGRAAAGTGLVNTLVKREEAGVDWRNVEVSGHFTGRLLGRADEERRYVENHLIASLDEEFGKSDDLLAGISDEEEDQATLFDAAFPNMGEDILGYPVPITTLSHLHPTHDQILWLFQMYVDNMDPFFKCFHVPTTRPRVAAAAQDTSDLPRDLEALLFGIYCTATGTLTDAQCQTYLQMPKASAFNTFLYGLRQSLVRAEFLRTSNLDVLRAFMLFLNAVRLRWDGNLVWVLTGIANRLGRKMGLHRNGIMLKLSPFETEMRKRLWTQLIQQDGIVTEVSGPGKTVFEQFGDAGSPLNLDDDELWPDMPELPPDREGASGVMLMLLRLDLGRVFGKLRSAAEGSTEGVYREKEAEMDEFEDYLQMKYVRFLDPLKPAHVLASIISRSGPISMRVSVLHPRWRMNPEAPPLPEADQELCFNLRLKIMQYYGLIAATESLHRFAWVYKNTFQWEMLIAVLNTMRQKRMTGPKAEEAWEAVQGAFAVYPEIIQRRRRALHGAVCRLTLKAWDIREQEEGGTPLNVPACIQELQRLRQGSLESTPEGMLDVITPPTHQVDATLGPDPSMKDGGDLFMGLDTLDWSQWQELMTQDKLTDVSLDDLDVGQLGQMSQMLR
ncbi:MAG: hypothetical protein M1828_000608 [Chrysothrix sp. TS-e1954]|nr:MAG: hypothetical protein M1828_000608 [Chrysothrix sp. TS-e1954]